MDRQTLVKILPWPNFVATGNKKLITLDSTREIITCWMVMKEKDIRHIMLDTKVTIVRSARMFMLTEFLRATSIGQF